MTELAPPRPPAHIEPFVKVLGVDLTITFLERFGGAELYLAANPTLRSKLVEVIGIEAAERLAAAAERAGGRWQRRVPTGKPWIAQVLHSKGLSKSEIARKLHVSDVAVRGWLRPGAEKRLPDTRQNSLF